MLRAIAKFLAMIKPLKEDSASTSESLTPKELGNSQILWIKEAQKDLTDGLKTNKFRTLSPFVDKEEVIRVGGRIDNALVSYEIKHPALLPYLRKPSVATD